MTEIRVATGPDDPRLYEVDEEFRSILGGLSSLAAASRIQKARFFHRTGTTARGTLRVLEAPRLPAHDFFTPGRKFHVLARYSNGMESDDIAPAIRGLTLRLLDPDRPDDFTSSLMDLTLSTGECFHTGSASLFALSGTEEGRSELMRLAPHTRSAIWGCYRRAVSYAKYHYYSQTPRAFIDRDGKQWFARFRVVPPGSLIDPGVYDPGDLMFPPDPPNELERRPDDYRSRTFLHEDVRDRVTTEGV